MKQRHFSTVLTVIATLTFLLFEIPLIFAQPYWEAPIPLDSKFQLMDMTYNYNPATQTLTKAYTFKNISGATLKSPRLVNLFLWSNTICSVNWAVMGYDGIGTYTNTDQVATVANNTGVMDWSALVTPSSIDSTELFPSLPLQSVQSGTDYSYWTVPSYPTQWPDGQTATIEVTFSNVQNCNWIQNMVWLVYEQEPTLIDLSMFQAVPGDGAVTLIWATESEMDNAGFNILRREEGESEQVRINKSLIPSKGTATKGAEYVFEDTGAKNGVTYIYTLEDVDIYGVSTIHGDVKATPRWVYSIFHR